MKTLIFTISFLLGLSYSSAQKTYLEIYENDNLEGVIMYPPGTPYELFDDKDNLIFNDVTFEGKFKILGNYTLKVYPSWKDDADVFNLSEGEIRATATKSYGQVKRTKYKALTGNGVSVEKFLSDSEKRPGKKNMTLKFSNGITFKYEDGEASATLDGEQLDIQGKYLVYCKLGVAKISFNPSNGVAWWIFEPQQ